jgi:hypothetical protein
VLVTYWGNRTCIQNSWQISSFKLPRLILISKWVPCRHTINPQHTFLSLIVLKNPSPWPVSNPQNLAPVASTLTTTPPRWHAASRKFIEIRIYDVLNWHVILKWMVGNCVGPNIVVEWLTFQLRFREVPGSNFSPKTSYADPFFMAFLIYPGEFRDSILNLGHDRVFSNAVQMCLISICVSKR